MPYGYIYKLTDTITGKIYIGAKLGNKINYSYFGSGSLWNKEIVSHRNPEQDIKRDILQWCDTVDELNDAEQYWIKYFNSTNPEIGYNILKGGNMPTEEYRKNMSQIIHAGMTDDRKQRISQGLKKYRKENNGLSATHKQRVSKALKGIKIGCNGDSRSINVYCTINDKIYSFHNKIQAAKWWFDNYPFSDTYAEITYTRKITDSINKKTIMFNGEVIDQPIKWYLGDTNISDDEEIYCIFEEKQYNFPNISQAAEWWHKHYPISAEYNQDRYTTKIRKNILGFEITYQSRVFNKIQWYRKENYSETSCN